MTDITVKETGMFTTHIRLVDEYKARQPFKNIVCTALKFVCMCIAYIHRRLILDVSQIGMILEVTYIYIYIYPAGAANDTGNDMG